MIVVRIKRIWLNKILSGEKKIEYRRFCRFYELRLNKNPDAILFLCGKDVHKYEIVKILIQDYGDLGDIKQFAIHLGKKLPLK